MASRRALCLALCAGLAGSPALASPEGSKPGIVLIGDSITLGQGATDPEEGGYAARIRRALPALAVSNAGLGGSSTRTWNMELPERVCRPLASQPKCSLWSVLVRPALPAEATHLLLGTNDALGLGVLGRLDPAGPVSPVEYEASLREIVRRAPGLVLVSSPPKNPNHLSDRIDARLRAYREAIARIVRESPRAEHGVDVYELLDPASDFTDIHPNDRGHAKIAESLQQRIRRLLPQARDPDASTPYVAPEAPAAP